MTDLKNINDTIMSLNESDLLHVMPYGSKKFDKYTNWNYQIFQRHRKV